MGGCRDQDDASGLLKLGLLDGNEEGSAKVNCRMSNRKSDEEHLRT